MHGHAQGAQNLCRVIPSEIPNIPQTSRNCPSPWLHGLAVLMTSSINYSNISVWLKSASAWYFIGSLPAWIRLLHAAKTFSRHPRNSPYLRSRKSASEYGVTSPSTGYTSFQRQNVPVNQYYWYWQVTTKQKQLRDKAKKHKITQCNRSGPSNKCRKALQRKQDRGQIEPSYVAQTISWQLL